jgi:hypothetical protein
MHHNNSPVARRSGGVLPRPRRWTQLSSILAAVVLAFGLVAFSFTAPTGGESLNLFGARIASADGGHGTGSKAATQTPTPTSDHQPEVKDAHEETEMSDTEKMDDMDDMGAEAAEESQSDREGAAETTQAPQSSPPQGDMDMSEESEGNGSEDMDMSDEHPNDGSDDSDDHEDSTSVDPESNGPQEMDINEEHADASTDDHDSNDSSGADDHDAAGSEEGGHTEYEGPSDLVKNITLGGFAGINGSVLLAAAILKKKNPKKEKGRGAANKAAPIRTLGGVTTVSTTSITSEVSTVSISLETERAPVGVALLIAVPVDEARPTIPTATTAGSPAPKGDDPS